MLERVKALILRAGKLEQHDPSTQLLEGVRNFSFRRIRDDIVEVQDKQQMIVHDELIVEDDGELIVYADADVTVLAGE